MRELKRTPVSAMHILHLGRLYAIAKNRKYFTYRDQQLVIHDYCIVASWLN